MIPKGVARHIQDVVARLKNGQAMVAVKGQEDSQEDREGIHSCRSLILPGQQLQEQVTERSAKQAELVPE